MTRGPRGVPEAASKGRCPTGPAAAALPSFLPAGQTLPSRRNAGSAPKLRCAGPSASWAARSSRGGGMSVCRRFVLHPLTLGDEARLGGIREAEVTLLGVPPRVHHHPSPPSLVGHSFIPQPYRPQVLTAPHPRAGAFLLAPGRVSLSPRLTGCAIVAALSCPGGNVELPQHDGRTCASGRPRSGGLGPVSQPQDLFHPRPRRKQNSWS